MNLLNNEVWTSHVVMGFQPIKYRDFPYGIVIPDNIKKKQAKESLTFRAFPLKSCK